MASSIISSSLPADGACLRPGRFVAFFLMVMVPGLRDHADELLAHGRQEGLEEIRVKVDAGGPQLVEPRPNRRDQPDALGSTQQAERKGTPLAA